MNRLSNTVKVLLITILAAASGIATIAILCEQGILPDFTSQLGSLFQSYQEDEPDNTPVIVSDSDEVSPTDADTVSAVPDITEVNLKHRLEFSEIFSEYDLVSLQIAVIDDGYITHTYSSGYANSAAGQLINDDTKVRVASLSKVLIGMAAMKAQEEGALDLDSPLSEQLGYKVGNPRYTSHALTMRDILTHTATIKDDASITGRSLQNFLQASSTYFGSARPGTAKGWAYSNAGIRAAGGIVEVLTNTTMHNYTEKHFFEPLGVDASYYAQLIEDTGNIATLYHCNGSVSNSLQAQLNRQYYSTPAGNCTVFAGGLTISAKDYARLICILLRDGEYDGVQYLSAESVADMETVQYALSGFDQCTVLRHKDDIYGRELYYHTGVAYGVLSFAAYDPEANEGFVITTVGSNRDSRDDHGIPKVCADFAVYILSEVLDGKAEN